MAAVAEFSDRGQRRAAMEVVVLAKRYFGRYYGVPWYNGASEWVTMRIDGDQRQGGRGGLSSWEWQSEIGRGPFGVSSTAGIHRGGDWQWSLVD